MEIFENKIKEIFQLIGEYGITQKPLDFRFPDKITEQDKVEFLIQVRKGFRLGQQQIIEEIFPLLKHNKELKTKELEAKRKKNKDELQQIILEKNLLDFKIMLLRHLADFIAWQIFRNDYYKAKRFYSGSRTRPDLLHSNLQSVLKAVEHFHNEDELNFALISDLTSFIDIGDILFVNNKGIFVVECKEGYVQQKIFKFIDELEKYDFEPKRVDYSDKNSKFFDQVDRTLNQLKKGGRVVEFINKEKGIDPFSEVKIDVVEAKNPREYYFEYLMHLFEESKEKNSTYGEVEEVIYIGVYRENKIAPSRFVFDFVVKELYQNYILIDYLSLVGMPLKEPLFFKPFGTEIIFDLMFGRLKLLLAINLDKFIELFIKNGIEAKWLPRKKTHKLLENGMRFQPFLHKNRAIQIKVKENEIVLGDSFLIYLLLDNITPSSLVERYRSFG